jgi:putative membrane protein
VSPTRGARARGALHAFATGIGMGAAELVPGFSGGTVALVAGLYERLVEQIRRGAGVLAALVTLRPRAALAGLRGLDAAFLVALLGGMALALLTLAAGVEGLLAAEPVVMSAAFLGLVAGATIVARRQFRAPRPRHALLVGAAAVVTFVVLGASPGVVAAPGPLTLALAGALAVSAWILPGVSGSFLLLLLGLYPVVIGAVAGRDLAVLAPFALGMVVGLAASATALDALLARAHDAVLALLVGLMVGSVRVLWPWPVGTGVGDPALGAPDGDGTLALAVALGAALAVVAFARAADRLGAGRSRGRSRGGS